MATYYVSTSGSNAYDGLDQDHPWQTLAYAESHATTAGDIILLKKGNIWTEGVALVALHITHGGSTGTYIRWNGNSWGTGSNAIIRATSDDVESIVRIVACKYVIFEHITVDGDDYATNGITIGADHNIFGSPAQNDERYITVQDCDILDCGDGGVGDYDISFLCQTLNNSIYNITVQRCTVNGNSNHGICFYNSRFTENDPYPNYNAYIGYNYITNCGQKGDGVSSNILITLNIIDPIVEYNTIVGDDNAPGISLGMDPAHPNQVPQGVIVRYNDVRVGGIAAFYSQWGYATQADVYYNIFYSTGPADLGCVYLAADYSRAGGGFKFFNNVMIQEGNTGAVFTNDDSTSNLIEFRNNILIHTGNVSNANYCFVSSTGSITHTNNLYHRTLAGSDVYFASHGGVIARSGISSFEPTAIEGNPVFVTNYTDFHLQITSPAINEGINIPAIPQYDLDNNPVADPPEIGAYEYGVTSLITIKNPYLGTASVIT